MTSVVSGASMMRAKARNEERRTRLKKNIVALVVSRSMQKRADMPRPTPEELEELDAEIELRLANDNCFTDATVADLVSNLRRKLLYRAPRAESTPVVSSRKDSLPPLDSPPVLPSGLCQTPMSTSASLRPESTLLRTDNDLSKSHKPAVIRRREMLMSDEKWHNVIAQDISRFHSEQMLQKERRKVRMQSCKKSLDDQVQHNESLRERRRKEERAFAEEEADRTKQWELEEKERTLRLRDNSYREAAARDHEIFLEREARRLDDHRQKASGARYRQHLQDQAREQMLSDLQKKQANTEAYRAFVEYNQAELDKKRRDEEAEKQHDKEMLRAYASVLEKQEKSRDVIVKKAEKGLPGSATVYASILEQQQARLQLEDERVKREVETFEKKQFAEERRRAEIANARKRDFVKTLGEQLRLKEETRLTEKQAERAFRVVQETAAKDSVEKERAVKLQKRDAAKSHLLELEKQVVEKHIRNRGDLQVGIARA
ncbi:hypothetical protein DIPPA_24486 [Diplonema papillatum]|nr:hypothetical protein DIPPA_24486 [Diplonema papillatum]